MRRPPRGWWDPLRQVALIVLAYVGYELVAGLNADRAPDALAGARAVVSAEQGLGLFFEPAAQGLILGHPVLIQAANWIYLDGHFGVTSAVLVWVYLRHNDRFALVRNGFLAAMAIALVVYALAPVAPPRLLGAEGFVDTLRVHSGIDQDHGRLQALINPFAAMPSMHVCFAVLTAAAVARLARRRLTRAVGLLYPVLILAVVVVTANHYWLDAVGGAVVAALALGAPRAAATVAARMPRRRRSARHATRGSEQRA